MLPGSPCSVGGVVSCVTVKLAVAMSGGIDCVSAAEQSICVVPIGKVLPMCTCASRPGSDRRDYRCP